MPTSAAQKGSFSTINQQVAVGFRLIHSSEMGVSVSGLLVCLVSQCAYFFLTSKVWWCESDISTILPWRLSKVSRGLGRDPLPTSPCVEGIGGCAESFRRWLLLRFSGKPVVHMTIVQDPANNAGPPSASAKASPRWDTPGEVLFSFFWGGPCCKKPILWGP